MKTTLSFIRCLEILSNPLKEEGPVKSTKSPFYNIPSQLILYDSEDEDEFYEEDELYCIFLFRSKRTAENIAEWLCRIFFEQYEISLEVLIYEVDLLPNRWGLFVREGYELDVKELIGDFYEDVC